MKNRKYIPNQNTDKLVAIFDCYFCIHKNKCIRFADDYTLIFCNSFKERAGIK